MNRFSFRDFHLWQSEEVFKMGTDTLLLGAIGSAFPAINVLEIGAGTGAISLMYASKNSEAQIMAVEVLESSFRICQKNFLESPFSTRMKAIHGAVQDFHSETPFDLILCNPPYFNNAVPSEQEVKRVARHQIGLDFYELVEKCNELMDDSSLAILIVPSHSYRRLKHIGLEHNLFVKEIWEIFYSDTDHDSQAMVLCMQKQEPGVPERKSIRVRKSTGGYHADYMALLCDFLPEGHFQ